MKRTDKWRYKRVQLDAEKQKLQTMLVNTSEELMSVHSEISTSAFNTLMGDPLERLDELMGELKERKTFL